MLKDKKNVISIWVGQVSNVKDMNAYLKEDYSDDDSPLSPFAADLKSWYDHDYMETNFAKGKGKSIDDLLDPCSYSNSYLEQAQAAAKKKKLGDLNAVILLFDTEYTGKRWSSKSPVKFLGSFSYSTKPKIKDSPFKKIKGHSKTRVGPVGFSPDDKYVVTCGFDGTVLIWDSETEKVIAPPKALTDGVSSFNALRITEDGSCLVSGLSKTLVQNRFPDIEKNNWKTIKWGLSDISTHGSTGLAYETVIDLKTGKPTKHQPQDLFEEATFIDDHNLILWTESGHLVLWNAKTGRRKWRKQVEDDGSPYQITNSQDGCLIGFCIDNSGYIFETKKGTLVSSFTDNSRTFRQIQFCDNQTFASIDYDGGVQTHSVKTGRIKKKFAQPRTRYTSGGLSVSGDGKWLSVVESNFRLLDVWRVRDGKHLGRYQAKKNKSRHKIDRAAFSNDGRSMVVGEFNGDVVFLRIGKNGLTWTDRS